MFYLEHPPSVQNNLKDFIEMENVHGLAYKSFLNFCVQQGWYGTWIHLRAPMLGLSVAVGENLSFLFSQEVPQFLH